MDSTQNPNCGCEKVELKKKELSKIKENWAETGSRITVVVSQSLCLSDVTIAEQQVASPSTTSSQ